MAHWPRACWPWHHAVPRFEKVPIPEESYSEWDSGWRYWVGAVAGVVLSAYIMSIVSIMIGVLGWMR